MQPVIDQRLPDKINNLDARLKNMEFSSQPELSDWRSLQPDYFTYSHANALAINNDAYNGSKMFSTGTKLRWKQTGDTNYRYAYITLVDSGQIRVEAGDDYSVANLPVTEIAFSNSSPTLGFPQAFSYTPTLALNTIVGTPISITDEGTVSADFRLDGDICYVTLNREFLYVDGTGDALGLSETLPIPASDSLNYRSWMSSYLSSNSPENVASIAMNASLGTEFVVVAPTLTPVLAPDSISYTLTFYYPVYTASIGTDINLLSTDGSFLLSTDGDNLVYTNTE